MAALKTIGNLLKGSGWVQAIVQAKGLLQELRADSFLRATHAMRNRRAHHKTAATLYILQQRAYECCGDNVPLTNTDNDQSHVDFESWCNVRKKGFSRKQSGCSLPIQELLVGLTSDPNVLRQWMVSGPEVAKPSWNLRMQTCSCTTTMSTRTMNSLTEFKSPSQKMFKYFW